jgi:ferrous iron transport protein B
MIIAGVLIIHVLDAAGLIAMISKYAGAPLGWLLGLPRDIASVLVLGFLRKDVSIALLAPFNLTAPQFIVAGVFMAVYLPCIASFFTLVKELGAVTALGMCGLTFAFALGAASALHLLFGLLH